MDLAAGRIVAVVISTGGLIGKAGELSAIPPTALQFNMEHDGLQLDTTRELLAKAPHFDSGHWPDFSQPGYAVGIYGAYKIEPYFNNTRSRTDNARDNLRAADQRALSPPDQGDNLADVKITAQIRNQIAADEDMSVNAINIRIITLEGRVTLSGPVNTTAEKQHIGEIAERIAKPCIVDNQLDVTITTTSK